MRAEPSSTLGPQAAPGQTGGRLRREVAVLCATEITTWGSIFYALPVAAGTIAATEGWSLPQVLGAFTVAQLVAGSCGFWVGRRIDRVGPRTLMTGGSVLGAVSLVAVGLAPSVATFYLAWVVAGVAMSATLYAPAFAAITGWTSGDATHRLRALTMVTLVAGLASTVFAPFTAWLLDPLGWRDTYFVLAAFVAATAPAHWFGLRSPWPEQHVDSVDVARTDSTGAAEFRQTDFWLLVAGMTLAGFAVSAVVINLVPLLTEHGLSVREAAILLGIGGVGQVAGRLLYSRVAEVTNPITRTRGVLAVVAMTTVGLAEISEPVVVVAALSFVGGMARGLFTLIRATAVADRWGTRHYGSRTGILAGSTMAAAALAPWTGALLADWLGGHDHAFWVLSACAVLSCALIRPMRRGTTGTAPTQAPAACGALGIDPVA